MSFPTALTAGQLAVLRDGHFYTDQYILVWDNTVIFQAQINQVVFASSFATITYDNVTVGAYTDIKSDYTCYVGTTAGDIVNADYVFRVRANSAGTVATSTVLYINETSAALADGLYIMVVKDVKCSAKLPRTITGATPATNSYPRDYELTFKRLKPLIYGLRSCYVGCLNSSSVYDLVLAPSVLLTDKDAAAGTWAWFIDGAAYQSGGAATQNVTVRFSTAGQYLLRVTYTDSLGNIGYFTTHVFILPANKSTGIKLNFDAVNITGHISEGWNATVNANFADYRNQKFRMDNVAEQTFVAVWYDTNQPLVTSDIVFCGRFIKETITNSFDPGGNVVMSTSFALAGITSQLGEVISRSIPILEAGTPTVFGEVENLTPWRALVYFLTEHTTFPNVASLQFTDVTEDYRYPRFGTGDSSALESMNDILFTYNAMANWDRTGGCTIDRMAWYLGDAARNALTTVANFTIQDMATESGGGILYSLQRGFVPTIGRDMGGGGVYNTTTGDVQVLRALSPAVAQTEGTELGTLNRQILIANSAIATAKAELGQRTTDDHEAREEQVVLDVSFPPQYWDGLNPHVAQWYTFTIAGTTNTQGVALTTADRWTCFAMSIGYDMTAGRPATRAQFRLETQGGDYQVLVAAPVKGEVKFYNPVMPVAPTYTNFPEEPETSLADPTNPTAADEPPFDAEDLELVDSPEDPSSAVSNAGVAIAWDASTVWQVDKIPTIPIFTAVTPTGAGTITHAKRGFSTYAWVMGNDGTNSTIFRTSGFGSGLWVSTALTGIYTQCAPGGVAGMVYVYCPDTDAGSAAVVYDFTVDEQGWVADTGSYVAGSYFTGELSNIGGVQRNRLVIEFTDDISLLATSFVYNLTKGEIDLGSAEAAAIYWDANSKKSVTFTAITEGSAQTISYSGTATAVAKVSVILNSSRKNGSTPSPLGTAQIVSVTLTYATDVICTQLSLDYGVDFGGVDIAGTGTGSDLAFDDQAGALAVYAAITDQLRYCEKGGDYADEPDGLTAPVDGLAISAFGTDTNGYVLGFDAERGGQTLVRVVAGARTNITPNDGVNNGLVYNSHCLYAFKNETDFIIGLFNFGGTKKLAYTADAGVTWSFNTQISASACYITGSGGDGSYRIYVADGATLWYGCWNGVAGSLTLYAKTTPSAALLGIELP